MAKRKSKGQTLNQYLNSLSEEERFEIKALGIHGSYNAKMGISEHLRKLAFEEITKLGPLATMGEKFSRTSEEQKEIAKKGGEGKFEKGYNRFFDWVKMTGFEVRDHENDSHDNFANALLTFKHNKVVTPLKLAPKTAAKYRKKYLSEQTR